MNIIYCIFDLKYPTLGHPTQKVPSDISVYFLIKQDEDDDDDDDLLIGKVIYYIVLVILSSL